MKIKKIVIYNHKNLDNFEINFDTSKPISILIGNNGSGKSNCLEAILIIFKFLLNSKEKRTIFGFNIDYECNKQNVSIKTDQAGNKIQITINGKKSDLESLRSHNYLPDNILFYYSGYNLRIKNLTLHHDDEFKRNTINSSNIVKRQIFYFNQTQFALVLLSFISSDLPRNRKYIEDKLRIKKLKKFQIVLNKPYWAKNNDVEDFWGGYNGEIKNFISYLIKISKQKDGLSLEFIKEDLDDIRNYFGYERDLFKLLDAAYFADVLLDVQMEFEKLDGKSISDINLSEGERQLITIAALTEFFEYKETLYLFDEPDTFLHPSWQKEFIREISENFINKNQCILTTHSPLFLNYSKNEIADVFKISGGKVYPYPLHYGTDLETTNYAMMDVENRPLEVKKDFEQLFDYIEDEKNDEAEELYKKLLSVLSEDKELIRARIELDLLKEINDVEDN
jgi:predicted ATPase